MAASVQLKIPFSNCSQAWKRNQAETRELIANAPQGGSAENADGPTDSNTELEALQNGLAAVKANAESADKRTQETLEAVHEPLAEIINKISLLDGAAAPAAMQGATPLGEQIMQLAADNAAGAPTATDTPAQAAGDAVAPSVEPGDQAAAPSVEFSPFEDPASINADQAPTAAVAPQPVAEPGVIAAAAQQAAGQPDMAQGDWLSVVRTHMRDQHGVNYEPAAAMQGVAPAQPAAAPGQTDFIAAARMAAEASPTAAPHQAPLHTGLEPAVPDVGNDSNKSILSSLLSRKSGKSADTPANENKADGSSRKRLILAAMVLLAAVSAYAMNSNMFGPKQVKTSALPQPVITQPVQPATTGKADLPAGAAQFELSQAQARPQSQVSTPAADPITTSSIAPQSTTDPLLSQQPAPVGQNALATAGQTISPSEPLPEQIGTTATTSGRVVWRCKGAVRCW